jgi:hypothetical protein
VTRPKFCKSLSIVKFVNELGNKRFFEKVLQRLNDKTNWCPIEITENLV